MKNSFLLAAVVTVVASGCSSSGDGASGGSAANVVQGDLAGQPMVAAGSTAEFSDDALATDRGYVSVSISDWAQTCALESGCPGAQVNFTLYVIGGTRADVRPGVYSVTGEQRGGFSYEVAGGAGRYDAQCTTGSGFAGYTSGTVTVEAVAPRVKGTFDLALDGGEAISGRFDALGCN